MKLRFTLLVTIAGLLGPASAHAATDGRRPNIVFILADDLGHADLASYGHPYARTPNIDRLVAEGIRFEQAYATAATCNPSRIGFMTGKLSATFREAYSREGPVARLTVTELLKRNGYRTGHMGKWQWHGKPGSYGIDEIDAVERRYEKDKPVRERGRDAETFDKAIGFIERHRDHPFYVNIWGTVPHFPLNPPPRHLAAFRDLTTNRDDFSESMQRKFDLCESRQCDLDQAMRTYLGSVLSLDEDVGRLLAKLDELGLRDNTIVVFSSDQGPTRIEQPARAAATRFVATRGADEGDRVNMMGYVGDLRGGKHAYHEGGVRIPFIVRWPGHVPAGRVDSTSVISGADWLPTLAAITGSEVETADLDGEDVSSAWLGKTFTRSKPLLWSTRSRRARAAVRVGDWKLHLPGPRGGALELYDLSADPGERHNVALEYPEVAAKLKRTIEAWRATLPDEYVRLPERPARVVYGEGLKHYVRARELEEEAAREGVAKGEEALAQAEKEYAEAIERYKRAVDLWPGYHPAWSGLCDSLSRTGHEKSLEACDRATATLAHSEGLAHHDRARELETEAAKAGLAEAEEMPAQAEKAYGEAIERYEKAVDLWPEFQPAWGGLCGALGQTGRYKESLEACDRAVAIDPRYTQGIEYRGRAYLGLGRLEEARGAYMELWGLDGNRAADLMEAMKRWVEERREDAGGLSDELVAAFATWVEERDALAGQAGVIE